MTRARDPESLKYALAGAAMGLVLSTQALAGGNPLANPDQIALEAQSLRLLATPALQAQMDYVTQVFSTDAFAATSEGQATLPGAVREVVYAAVVDSINRDPTHPRVQWLWSPAHAWFRLQTPASKVLMPNVDNVFRVIPVDGASHYRLTAKPSGPLPVQVSVQLLPAMPAEPGWNRVIQELIDTDIQKAADGSFTLTIGPEPAAALSNHIATTPAAHFILIRDTVQDWGAEAPFDLRITRLDGPRPAPALDDAVLAARAAALAREIAPVIRDAKGGGAANIAGFFQGPANTLSAPKVREGGRWGLSSSGHFQLGEDDALVITLDPMGARYLSVQLANGWLGSLDYIHHTASLNLSQTRRNADGTVTLVVAAQDPGLANWLDTTGLHQGSVFVRWQALTAPVGPNAVGVRGARVMKLANLASLGPRITPQERRRQLADRAAAYERRFAP